MTDTQIATLFRNNLRVLREGAGLSQTDLARAAGFGPGFICDLEAGRRTAPTLRTLARLAEALGVAPAMLISQADTPSCRALPAASV